MNTDEMTDDKRDAFDASIGIFFCIECHMPVYFPTLDLDNLTND